VQQFDADWYKYQAAEIRRMNSSTFPDSITPEEEFRDYMFTSRTIDRLKQFVSEPEPSQSENRVNTSSNNKPFMLGIGYKSPHLCMHIPFKYYDMYRDKVPLWQSRATAERLQYPLHSPTIGFGPSINGRFKFMNDEGRVKFNRSIPLPLGPKTPFPADAYVEAMWGYSAAVSFVDAQLGRLLDAVDKLKMWDDVMIVLTSDHGMHNGEKGMW
jgi:arylsulfatase A-like enzyme